MSEKLDALRKEFNAPDWMTHRSKEDLYVEALEEAVLSVRRKLDNEKELSARILSYLQGVSKPIAGEKTEYAVRFRYYQYNDGRANNGHIRDEITFESEAEAIGLYEQLAAWLKDGADTSHFIDQRSSGGYLTNVFGVFKVVTCVSPIYGEQVNHKEHWKQ